MPARPKARTTSNTECCLMNMVDRMIRLVITRDAIRRRGRSRVRRLFWIANQAPRELYTWMLGRMLLGLVGLVQPGDHGP